MNKNGTLPAYQDESLSTGRRVEDLLQRMTLVEKVAQLTAVPARRMALDESQTGDEVLQLLDEEGKVNFDDVRELLGDGIGHFTRLGGGSGLEPEQLAAVTDELQTYLVEETRLGIPAVPHEGSLSGYMGANGTTYPQMIGAASTWAPDLIERMSERIRKQLLAVGCLHTFSPCLDVARDPRWGRTEETFGEDPYFVAEMASAYVRGLQGAEPSSGVSATVKHFAGHAVSEGGMNRSSVQIGEREFREIHLFPFEAAIRETGAESVMNAYHDVDGIPCAKDRSLLTGILREEWGFDGTVVADYFSVRYLKDEHGVAANRYDAAIQALEAGIDVELPQVACYDRLIEAVENGDVAERSINAATRRVLHQKMEKGLLDDDPVDVDAVAEAFGPDVFRDYARKLGRESITLLKNADNLLPLDGDESVAVVGPKADSPEGQVGDYAYVAHYPDKDSTRDIVTPLEGMKEQLGDQVSYTQGCTTTGPSTDQFDEAVATVEASDIAVAFVGTRSAIALSEQEVDINQQPDIPTSGEGADVTDLQLPGVQQELVETLAATETPLVVVQVTGKPHAIDWIDEHVPAVLQAWLPGEEGGHGIAEVLLGDHNPSGRLPISVPKSVGQLPVYYGRKPNSRNESHVYFDEDPLYPFGYGLSYTKFGYSELSLSATEVGPADTITATVTVTNTGDVSGHEVVQLYIHQRTPSIARPVQELVGFQRIHLDPGESATVNVTLSTSQLAFHDTDMDLVVEPDEYEVRVGRSAEDIESTSNFEITGERHVVPPSARAYFSESSIE